MEKRLHVSERCGEPVIGQAVEEDLSIALPGHAIIQKHQHPPIRLAADEPAKSLLQCDSRLWDLVIVKRIAALAAHALDARFHYRIAGHRKRQPIYDNAAQLLARHIHALPERRSCKKHAIRG